MAERPILFSAPMVCALLAGMKTQTRRVAKLNASGRVARGGRNWHVDDPAAACASPYGGPGDSLWVREAWRTESDCYNDLSPSLLSGEETILYDADADWSTNKTVGRARASMHMPRWASRISLPVTAIRIQRLQDISQADAIAEGCPAVPLHSLDCASTPPTEHYRRLWDSINGAGSWAANPLVWVVTFAAPNTPRGMSRPSDGQKVIRDAASGSVRVPIEDPTRDGGGHPAGFQSDAPPQREANAGGVTSNAGAPGRGGRRP